MNIIDRLCRSLASQWSDPIASGAPPSSASGCRPRRGILPDGRWRRLAHRVDREVRDDCHFLVATPAVARKRVLSDISCETASGN
jgi:hypothetical protein